MTWYTLALISALCSAAAAITQKKVLFKLTALEFTFVLSLFDLAFSFPFFLAGKFADVNSTTALLLYGKTVLGALAFLSVMLSLKNLEISGALPLLVLTPAFTALFAFLFIGESLTSLEITGMALLLIGTYVLEAKHGQRIFDPFKVFISSKKHHYVVAALALFTITSILDKVFLKHFQLKPNAFMALQQTFLAFNYTVFVIIRKKNPARIFRAIGPAWPWIAAVSVCSVIYRYTQLEAVKLAPVALVLSVKRISVFISTVVGGKLFHEHHLVRKAIATVILLSGAFFLARM